jgi:hypothetical protein
VTAEGRGGRSEEPIELLTETDAVNPRRSKELAEIPTPTSLGAAPQASKTT